MKLPALALIPVIALLSAACASSGRTASTSVPTIPTVTPAAVTQHPPTAGPATTPAATRPQSSLAAPPNGTLAGGGSAVEGWLGSYCWQGTCADAGGIPPKTDLPRLDVGTDELSFALSDGSTFVRWAVSYGESSDGTLAELAEGGAPFDPDALPQSSLVELNSVGFDSPPPGDWSLLISLRFPGGDLSHAWHVIVPES